MSMYSNEFKKIDFNNCNMSNSEVMNCSFKGIDLSSCDISNIGFDNYSVRGVIIDSFQAMELIHMLGVKIK